MMHYREPSRAGEDNMKQLRHNLRPEVVPKVLEVLRTSKQCTGALCTEPGTFCVLGAICEAYRLEHPEAAWIPYSMPPNPSGNMWGLVCRPYQCEFYTLPPPVRDWACGSETAIVEVDGYQANELNDCEHDPWTFDDFIEALTAPATVLFEERFTQ